VLTTHDLGLAYRLEARVLSLHDGRAVGATPDNVFPAEIVGGGAVREARLGRGPSWTVVTDASGAVHVAIDPRDILLSREPLASTARNRFRGRVVAAETAGGCVRISLDVGVPLVVLVTPESYRELGLSLGDELHAAFKASAVRVY
jgi:molybdopterin-binding protein